MLKCMTSGTLFFHTLMETNCSNSDIVMAFSPDTIECSGSDEEKRHH